MPTESGGFRRYNYDDPADLKELIDTGLIWHASQAAQKKAIDSILAGDAQLNDKVPSQITAWIENKQKGAPA